MISFARRSLKGHLPNFQISLPPSPHLELIYNEKFTQPPLLSPLVYDPFLPPLLRTLFKDGPQALG